MQLQGLRATVLRNSIRSIALSWPGPFREYSACFHPILVKKDAKDVIAFWIRASIENTGSRAGVRVTM